ncbi:right-handed parallel beta-helix repeat-containing protein [Microbacterium sp. 77mftsu3.1]|uniref:right-handed parallel beta-helix repeat-containing protein n=1 Tax=Microbacterium sp. 77mftsu3.1 TaxID=1761802 RepID=UPI00035F332D|nr:right-handed parallel beta-helix repeat-containing protein [Microbacterium sp. 77mftsu3.1]SDH23046.1 parallel beta-helix repeat (two copies) [Microbacterium sp. 77mftsu3.1]
MTAAAVALSLVAAGSVFTATGAAAATRVTDSFNRTVATGWGTSTSGAAWTTSSSRVTSVRDGAAAVLQAPGTATVQSIRSLAATDSILSATVWPEKATTTGNGSTISLALRSDGKYSYQARVGFGRSGVNLWISRFDGSSGREVVLRSLKPIKELPAGAHVRAEFSLTGTSPVKIRARIWTDGAAKPEWQASFDDASAQRIARVGYPAISTYLSSSSRSNTVRIDDVDISDAASPTPTPTPPPTPPVANGSVGSAPVGSTSYPVPARAIFVAPRGTQTGSGTANDPYGSAAYAVSRAPSGSTIVLRGGTYREYVYVGFNKALTIQAYPGEAVWFDGSSPVTGWARSGNTWVKTGWTHRFDHSVSFTAGRDDTSRFVDDTNPLAGYPDQVWIDDQALRQVGSASAVTAGTFFVDEGGRRLVIGSDPNGRRVEASTLARAFKVQGKHTTLRGFGVERYATTVSMMGAVTAEVDDISLENMVVRDNATIGVYAWNDVKNFRRLTVTGNGLMGLGVNKAADVSLTDSVIARNNAQRFKPAPAAGGVKITEADGVRVDGNIVSDNIGSGVWFDVNSRDIRVTGNTVSDNTTTGVQIELSENAIIADNHLSRNVLGAKIMNSGEVDIWNNTIDAATRALSFAQDERRQPVSGLKSIIPWLLDDVTVRNNVISYGTDSSTCPILAQDSERRLVGAGVGVAMDSNVYFRRDSSTPANLACWANGANGTKSVKTLSELTAFTGNDGNSALWTGTPILSSSLTVRSDVLASPRASLSGLPSDVAASIGVAAGTKRPGAFSPALGR